MGRDIGLEYGAIIGDDRYASILLPQRKRLALLEADLQLTGIGLEYRGVCDPRIGLEVLANLLNVEKRQRCGAGDFGAGEHFLPANMMIAAERNGYDTKAGRVSDAIASVPSAFKDAGNVIPSEGPVGNARDNDEAARGNSRPARPFDLQKRGPAVQIARDPRPRAHLFSIRGAQLARTSGEARAHSRDPCQRLSEASAIIHCTNSSNVMPACAASSGTSDVSVMPGCVLISRHTSPPVPSIRSS